ncbi:RlpA-like double-psi beta-barrel-protein domain-containing protein-containing protein, partial [Multifurca ochricompacta]
TNYKDGLGSCGQSNGSGDFIVALNPEQYDGGAHCGETITITFGGKTAQATVEDLCPGCGFGELDFSDGLFGFFAPLGTGIIYGEWSF